MQLRLSVCLLLFLQLLIAGQASPPEEDTANTASVVVDEIPKVARVPLGSFRFGETVRATILLRNSLDQRLTISAIDPDCGCLSVKPDKQEFPQGEGVRIALELAPAKKLANVRRAIRIFFNETSSPLILNVDVQVIGPLHLEKLGIDIKSTGESVEIRGKKTDPGLTISDWASVRGAFQVEDLVGQDEKSFRFTVKPLFSFGNAGDLLRITYRDASAEEQIVDLPLEFRVSDPLRFLPSTVRPERKDQHWVARARMILTPSQEQFDLTSMEFVAHGKSGEVKPTDCDVKVTRASSVLCFVDIAIRDDAGDKIPERLTVQGADRNVLGTLYFSAQ